MKLSFLIFFLTSTLVICSYKLRAQNYELVFVTGVISGNETNNALYKVFSKTNASLAYIRAQKIAGPQDGVFTQRGDNIRYTSVSKEDGIPANLSRIRFTFLKLDKRTLISPTNFRFGINDIDGPNNEALATNCNEHLRFLGTANPTNLIVLNMQPSIIAVGAVEENEGPTSRLMFEFENVSVVEFDNYANDGYLKDFDMNDDYLMSKPILVSCKGYASNIYTELDTVPSKNKVAEFKSDRNLLMVNTNPIYFDKDKFDIRPDAEEVLVKVLHLLNKYPELIIEIGSHTDSRAADNYNLELSDKRAKASINWLVKRGVESSRVIGKGYGETQLVNKCSNAIQCTDNEHQLNRRTEFVIVNPDVLKKH